MNANCKCGRLLRPGYIRCWRCELTAKQLASAVAEDSSVTAANRMLAWATNVEACKTLTGEMQ